MPPIRILLALVFGVFATISTQALASLSPNPWYLRLISLVAAVLVYLAYRLYVEGVERRTLHELSLAGACKELGVGLLMAAGLLTLSAVLAMLGIYRVSGYGNWVALLAGLLLAAT